MTDHPIFDRADLVVHTTHKTLPKELTGSDSFPEVGEEIELEEGVTVTYNGNFVRKDFSSPPSSVLLLVDVAADVGKGVLAAWLYDQLKDKEVRIETKKGSYEATKEQLRQAIDDLLNDE